MGVFPNACDTGPHIMAQIRMRGEGGIAIFGAIVEASSHIVCAYIPELGRSMIPKLSGPL